MNAHYTPIYRQSFYANMDKYDPGDAAGAEGYYSSAIYLPTFPDLEGREVAKLVHLFSARAAYQGVI